MSLLSKIRGYGILTVALIVFSVSVFFSVDKMLKEQATILTGEQENVIWATSQTEVELYRLLDAFRSLADSEPGVDQEAVARRFDIFVSQFQVLRQGKFAEVLRVIEGYEDTVNSMWDRLEAIEPKIIYLKPGEREVIGEIHAEIRAFAKPLRALSVEALHQDEARNSERQARIQEVYLELIGYFVGILVSGTILAFLLFRGMYKARRLLAERRETEERLRDSEQRFRDFASSASDWLWETDNRLRFTYFSKGYLEQVGINAVLILGKTFEELCRDEEDKETIYAFRDCIDGHQPFREFRFRIRPNGEDLRQIKVSGVPIFDEEGELVGYRGTGTDITAQVEAETEAERVRTLLSDAVEALAEGFAMFDPEDRLVLCNSKFREFYPQSSDLIQHGATFEQIMRGAVYRGQFSVPKGQEESWLKFRLERHTNPQEVIEQRLSDGRWLQVNEQMLPNGWHIGTRVDITDLKQREEALRREALIWEQMHDGVIITDLDGHITNWNPSAEAMFGYSASEVMGRTPGILRRKEEAEARTQEILAAVMREGRWSGEIVFVRKDRSEGICEAIIAPLRTDQGDTIATIWVIHDITQRKRTEIELLGAKDQAEQASSAKSNFLATMSHEIRTPMNGVLGMMDLLLDTPLDEEQHSYAETARESGQALLTIIDDILDFSKMEAGKLTLERTDIDLRGVVDGVVDLLASHAAEKGIEIAAFVEPQIPAAVRGDPARVRQVLLNLVGNAVKFTESGGISITVIRTQVNGGQPVIRFEVLDTGVGIPEARQGEVFAEFTQADPSYTRKFGGTGLGLAISKRLAELMGGEIGVSSTPGVGSNFWFTVPLEERPGIAAATPDYGLFAGLRVLLVEDNEISREVIRKQLSAQGVNVTGVADGHSALAALHGALGQGMPFGVAVLDSTLPDMDGIALSQEIRRNDSFAGTRLILATPLSDRAKARQAAETWFDAQITKPIKQTALYARIAQLTGRVPQVPLAESAPAEAAATVAAPTPEQLRHARLLLAEDSPVNQVLATTMLSKAGYHIDAVNNGREAVEAVQARAYDMVLMDVSMPEMDGFEATAAIRALPGDISRIPIIAMTAHAMEGDREKCFQAGMNDYISKPVNRQKLLDTVARWLGAHTAESLAGSRPAATGGDNGASAWSAAPGGNAGMTATGGNNTAARPANGNGRGTEAPAVPRNGQQVLDTDVLQRLVIDTSPEILHDLIKTFITETAERLRRMSTAAVKADMKTLEREAHALKSSSGAFGAKQLQEQAQALEMACRSGNANGALDLLRPIHSMALAASKALVGRSGPPPPAQ